jgi:hypothetical protein
MNRRCLLSGLAAAALTPALAPLASAKAFHEERNGTLLLEKAPIRSALELLFTAYRRNYSIDTSVAGIVSLSSRNQPFESQMRAIMHAHLDNGKAPLNWKRENGVDYISTTATKKNLPEPPPEVPDRQSQRDHYNSPYRVAGVWYEKTKQGDILTPMAILEFTSTGSNASEIYMVKPGDSLPGNIDPATKASKFTNLGVEEVHPAGLMVSGVTEDGKLVRFHVDFPRRTDVHKVLAF